MKTDEFKKQRQQVISKLIVKTEAEFRQASREPAGSRSWTSSHGYKFLVQWSNLVLLRILIRKFTVILPLRSSNIPLNSSNFPLTSSNLHFEDRLKTQLDDAGRSTVSNLEEGYKRDDTKSYIKFLSYSQGSLEEVKGDIYDSKTDGFLPSRPGSNLESIGINLRVFKGPSKGQTWGEPTEPGHPYYKPLQILNPKNLTYEIFIELINKTDFLLRKLVVSLETKIQQDKLKLL